MSAKKIQPIDPATITTDTDATDPVEQDRKTLAGKFKGRKSFGWRGKP